MNINKYINVSIYKTQIHVSNEDFWDLVAIEVANLLEQSDFSTSKFPGVYWNVNINVNNNNVYLNRYSLRWSPVGLGLRVRV